MRIATLAGVAAVALVVGLLLPISHAHAYERVVEMTFPMEAGTYDPLTDTYDDWRNKSAGRRHQASDIMADYGTPVYAAVGGTISRITGMGCGWSGSGAKDEPPHYGYAIYIDADDGREYTYLHFGRQDGPASEAYAPGLTCGSRVERGEHLGYAGHSGHANSRYPHLHLSIADPDVEDPYDYYDHERLNPYPSLAEAERRGDFPGFDMPSLSGDAVQIAGDWNGDGRQTPGWYDQGRAHLLEKPGIVHSFPYGKTGDLPIVGDWNGNGQDTLGVVRDGRWYLRHSSSKGPADTDFKYGRVRAGDYPLAGDWDGDGTDTVGIVRDGEWHLRHTNTAGPGQLVYKYGRVRKGDIPVMGDWSGDGQDTPAIVRGREWHLRYVHEAGAADEVFKYGASGDDPVVGDWRGDGTTTPGVVRERTWLLRNANSSGTAHMSVSF